MHKKIQYALQPIKKYPARVAIAVVCIFVVVLFAIRYGQAVRLNRLTKEAAIPIVLTIQPKPTAEIEKIVLPGSLLAWHESPVFARANGFLKVWYVDIGYKVRKGDVLAIIERPELDAELKEAEDLLKVVTAQYRLAVITAKRWGNLVKSDSVSKQANDDKRYQAAALAAELSKARANVEKLRAYVSFEKVIAPFTGTISLRQTDIGDLINVGSNPAQAKPLFRIVQTDPLRLYVNIPQLYSTRIKPNMKVKIKFAEHPGKVFSAQLLKTAGAIDPITLTLQAEFRVENKKGLLIPGSYSVVDFSIQRFSSSVIIPVNVIIFRAQGLQVAVVNKENCIDLKSIDIATDFGQSVQINSGIKPGDRIVLNPVDSLYQGQTVRISNHTAKSTV